MIYEQIPGAICPHLILLTRGLSLANELLAESALRDNICTSSAMEWFATSQQRATIQKLVNFLHTHAAVTILYERCGTPLYN